MRNVGFQPAEPLTVWAVTDGRAGIESQALGLAEAIGRRTPIRLTTKRVCMRTPWRWLPSGFVPFPRQAMAIGSDALISPWPDIWIGCGRASIPYSMGVRRWSNARAFVVQLQDPRVNVREFDVVIPPVHDGLEGQNVLSVVGACHRVTPERIEAALGEYPLPLEDLPNPRIAVLIGGKSKRQNISAKRARAIADALAGLQRATGGALLVSLSRRTSEAAKLQLRTWLAPHCAVFYEGEGVNPYFALLGAADYVFVTADSVNMATEAAATGKPIYILPVDGEPGKLARFHKSLEDRGCARPFKGKLESWTYAPLMESDRAAAAVLSAWAARVKQ